MWQRQNTLRGFLFCVFFLIGVLVLVESILCEELLVYLKNSQAVEEAEKLTEKLISLNSDYDALLQRFENDPDIIDRIAPAALGISPNDPDVLYPKIAAEELAAAKKALQTDNSQQQGRQSIIQRWLERSCQPHRRAILFFAGAFLILISFICFGPAKKEPA